MKTQHNPSQNAIRRTFHGIYAREAAPMLEFYNRELLFTSKIRHSSVGWNPVHRIFKHLDGLGPSPHLKTRWGRPRWDDGVMLNRPLSFGRMLLLIR